jgi:hypothetical protein
VRARKTCIFSAKKFQQRKEKKVSQMGFENFKMQYSRNLMIKYDENMTT